MNIKSLRMREKEIVIVYDEISKNNNLETHTLTSPDEPLESFRDALQALAYYAEKIAEERDESSEKMEVRGFTISKTSKEEKLTIIVKMPVDTSNSPKNIPTPGYNLKKEEPANPQFHKDLNDRVADLLTEVKNYINGHRKEPAQGNLKFEEEKEPEEAEVAA